MAITKNRYTQILEAIFRKYYVEGSTEVVFDRTDIVTASEEIGIKLPKNIGDVPYSFRYRVQLPEIIKNKASEGNEWMIRPAGRARYKLVLVTQSEVIPSPVLVETKILDATPGIINKYALNDEQALLSKLRYNRLIDIFTGLVCYSLQNHLRTTVPEMGQVETDEIYVGVDKRGAHFILPIQAKGKKDKIGIVQIEQDLAICSSKFPQLICRPIAAQFLGEELIALFELELTENGIGVSAEKHYRLVRAGDLSAEELQNYQRRSE